MMVAAVKLMFACSCILFKTLRHTHTHGSGLHDENVYIIVNKRSFKQLSWFLGSHGSSRISLYPYLFGDFFLVFVVILCVC